MKKNNSNFWNWKRIGIHLIILIVFLFISILVVKLLNKAGYNLNTGLELLIGFSITIVSFLIGVAFDYLLSTLSEIKTDVENNISQISKQTNTIAQGIRLSETYKDLSSIEFSSELIGYMKKIKSDDKTDFDGKVIQLAEKISSSYLEKNKNHELWYIIYYQYLIDEFETTSKGKMNIHLNSYLKIYLEFMNYYLERCERDGRKFHIVSFTNAIPTDWFKESKTTGGNVIDFSVDKIKSIRKMKDKGHTLRMYVLSGGGDDLEAIGIKSKSAVRKDWLKLSNGERNKYLKDLHTSSENALLLNLKIDNLIFEDNLTEYIYFGTSQNNDDIQWEWCISGSYSRFTNNMLANFEFLLNENENVIVDVPNKEKLNFKDGFKPPQKLEITYKDFPKYILKPAFSEILMFKEILTLQVV